MFRLAAAIAMAVACCAPLSAHDPSLAIREKYLGPEGLPSPADYARAHAIAPIPGSESFTWQVVFRFAYREADVGRVTDAEPVYTDCSFVRRRQYEAAYRAEPVWDGRVYPMDGRLVVAAYTPVGERIVSSVSEYGHVREDSIAGYSSLVNFLAFMRLDAAKYDPFTGRLWRYAEGDAIVEEQRFHLPLTLVSEDGHAAQPEYRIERLNAGEFVLTAHSGDTEVTLARCEMDAIDIATGRAGYLPIVQQGCTLAIDEPTILFDVPGEILAGAVDATGPELALKPDMPLSWVKLAGTPAVEIDGRFDEWRGSSAVSGVSDPEGDVVWYLDSNPDTDLLEFKVTSDDEHLYFYTRVAGQHGNTGEGRDRYYFYVYIDADRNPATGYIPTRDDDCYYGVAIGDDCEAQFEFVGGRFVKTFFGFAGGSTEKEVLAGRVTLAPSWYSKHDEQGRLRDGYKVEYVRQGDEVKITEDFAEGSTDDIVIAFSPDGSECEMRAALSGFLRDASGRPIIAVGQSIDLAAGVEASGLVRGNTRWSADSTAVIRGYRIGYIPSAPVKP
jgi:hypothetical protein